MRRNCLLRFLAATLCAVVFSSAVAAAQAQEPPVKPAPAGTDEARIVAQLVAKETAFQRAFAGYSFEREAIIQSIGMGRQVTGEYFRRSRISFDPQGVMRERVIKMPVPGLAPSQTDIDDLNTIQLFVKSSPPSTTTASTTGAAGCPRPSSPTTSWSSRAARSCASASASNTATTIRPARGSEDRSGSDIRKVESPARRASRGSLICKPA
ncbi:MAG: hypothetical protein LC774_10110 [Acidobacteria bacterium]|nr:hypothetical protein [Acidobacteriota bacterium]